MMGVETGRLISIQVGVPSTHKDEHGEWTSGFFKSPVASPVRVLDACIEGDGQADLKHHGGPDKAILAYSADHFEAWNNELGNDFSGGAFGENLTVSGLTETDVCIGDQWQIGGAILEVTQPRQPCWKLGRRWGDNSLPKLVVQSGRSGWYLRVLQTGLISSDSPILRLNRPNPDWTIERANDTFYRGISDEKIVLASVSELSEAWRNELTS